MHNHTDRVAHTTDCAALTGIFYMYNHTDRVAHTTDCAALAGIFYMYNHTHRVAHTTDCAALAGTRNSSLGSPIGINLMTSRHERTLPLNHVPLNIRFSGYVLRDRSDDLSHH